MGKKTIFKLEEERALEFMYRNNADLDLRKCKFLGEGHNGKVFLRPDGKVYKICKTDVSCKDEYYILEKVQGSKYFPKVYSCMGIYMIRDYVGGENMKSYIRRKGMSKELASRILELLDEFKKLGFSKIDIRCKDIFVQKDGSLLVIDPKGCYTRNKPYPTHLMKGLCNLKVLKKFLKIVKHKRPDLYKEWALEAKKLGYI